MNKAEFPQHVRKVVKTGEPVAYTVSYTYFAES